MSDQQHAYYQPYLAPPRPKRWPWIVAVVAAFVIGGIAGYTVSPNAITSGSANDSDQMSTVSAEPAKTWPTPGNELAEPLEAVPAGGKPPAFPDAVEDYSLSREWRETVRAFEDVEWATVYEFPATMNGCDLQRFYVRWRTAHEQATVEATVLSSTGDIVLEDPVAGAAGWMSGYGCGQPAFRMKSSADESTLTDVVIEIQQWEISV